VLAPASVDVFFSPGYRWESYGYAAGDDVYGSQPLLAGRTYGQTFNAAVFSPSPSFGPMVEGNSLGTTDAFVEGFLVDAANRGATSTGVSQIYPQGWLYEGSKLLAHVSGGDGRVAAKIAATAHTYTLKVEATRPGGGISKSVTASYTFTAKAGNTSLQTSNFSPRMLPQNLSASNAAAAGSTTSVPITFSTVNGVIAAHDVAVWASSNGGKTWSALKVAHHGSAWTVSVANPKAAGYVSLRVQGEDAAGSKTEVTVIDAYGVS
jgi:hypothetical protein